MARRTRRRMKRQSRRKSYRGGAAVLAPDHYNGVVRMFRSLQSRGMNTISEGGIIHHYASTFVDPANAPGYPVIMQILNQLIAEGILKRIRMRRSGEIEFRIVPGKLIPIENM